MSDSSIKQIPVTGNVSIITTQAPVANAQVIMLINPFVGQYLYQGVGVTDASGNFSFNATNPDVVRLILANSLELMFWVVVNQTFVASIPLSYTGGTINLGVDQETYNTAIAGASGDANVYILSGNVKITETGAPVPNTMVNVYDSVGTHQFLCRGFTDSAGNFSFLVSFSINTSLIASGTIIPSYDIIVNGLKISSQTMSTGSSTISVSQAEYDAGLANVPVQKFYKGRVVIEGSNVPIPSMRIDAVIFYAGSGSVDIDYGYVGGCTTDSVTGAYLLPAVNDPDIDLYTMNILILGYSGNAYLSDWVRYYNDLDVDLTVTQAEYDTFMAGSRDTPPVTPLNIQGKVIFAQSGLPLSGVEVDLMDSTGGYGRIGSATTDPSGNFSFTITDPSVANQIRAQIIIPTYKILQNCTYILSQTTAYTISPVQINVNQSVYDAAIPCSQNPTIQFMGSVVSGGIVASGLTVNIYENGFRTKVLLNSTITDINGQYSTTVSTRNLNNISVLAGTSVRIEVVATDDTLLVASNNLTNLQPINVVDLVVPGSSAVVTTYANALSAVQAIIGPTPISSLIVDPSTNTNEIEYVSNATGKSPQTIQNMVQAYSYADSTSLDANLLFGLVQTSPSARSPIMNMTKQEMEAALQSAVANNVIPESSLGGITTFLNGVSEIQLTKAKTINISGETHTLGDVLSAVFGSPTDVDNFLTKHNEKKYTNNDDFWADYAEDYPSTLVQKAKTGIQLTGLTGFQPQIIGHLTSYLETNNLKFSDLSRRSATDWFNDIKAVCAADSTLYVPAGIRGSATYPNDPVIQQYANILSTTINNLHPLTNVSYQLEQPGGDEIIPDATQRGQVMLFLNNNPDFDVRINSIHDINSHDYNTIGITDLSQLKVNIAPFQRVMRLTGGNPTAVTAMIKNGHNSSLAIAQLGLDQFTSLYNSYFTPVVTSESTSVRDSSDTTAILASVDTARVFTTAAVTNLYSVHTIANARQNMQLSDNGVLLNFNATIDSETAAAEPNLATMFGSLDYCSCDACTSLYSPSAYLTDLLNFMSTQANPTLESNGYTAAYNELLRRRPDIAYIDLSCKNTNTLVPYIDLVNELLEIMVLKSIGTAFSSHSLQTTGTQAELAAYPEHTIRTAPGVYGNYTGYSKVYSLISGKTTLANAVYPANLPFSLPVEETRSYMQYLGNSRYQMMELFMPFLVSPISYTNEITGYSMFAEWLGIPQASADIITKSSPSITPWIFYGFNSSTVSGLQDPEDYSILPTGPWNTLLCGRIDVLIKQTGISYAELLQFLGTNFINPGSNITIVANSSATTPNTCSLNQLMLSFAGSATMNGFLDKLYRFTRLYRSNTLTVIQWDILLRSFGILQLDSSPYVMNVPWPLFTVNTNTSTNTNGLIVAENMIAGSHVSASGAYNSNGYNCQVISGDVWPQSAADGYSIDFPIFPVVGGILTINEIDFTIKYSGNTQNQLNYISFAYSLNNGASFTPFGTVTTVSSQYSWNAAYPYAQTGLNLQCNNADGLEALIIRMYIFTDVGVNHSRHVYVSKVSLIGTVATISASNYISGTKNGDNLTEFEVLGKGIRMADELGIAPELLAAWWSDIDTYNYLDYNSDTLNQLPTIYQSIFSNKNVLNDPSNNSYIIFSDPTQLSHYDYISNNIPVSNPVTIDNSANIASLCRMAQSDVVILLNLLVGSSWASTPMSLTIFSRIYVLGQISKASRCPVSDLVAIIGLLGININLAYPNPGSNTVTYSIFLDNLDSLLDTLTAINLSAFSVNQYNYLINNVDVLGTLEPLPDSIETFYETLRTDLNKYTPTFPVLSPSSSLTQLTNVIYQHFSSQFNIPSQWVQDIIDPGGPSTGFTLALVASSFLGGTTAVTEANFPLFYIRYRQIYKCALIANALKLTTTDFELFYLNGSITGFYFTSIPVTNGTTTTGGAPLPTTGSITVQTMFQGLLCVDRWVQVRNRLYLPDGGLSTLLNPSPGPTSKLAWLTFFEANTTWSSSFLTSLVGTDSEPIPSAGAPDNLLRTSYPGNFTANVYDNISIIFTINSIAQLSATTGLSPASMRNVLIASLTLDDSHKILIAAKGATNDSEWANIAKPLRDPIRKKQRDALVAFVLAYPPTGNLYRWQKADDLYSYLLLDVQTEPAVLTSRIRQAVSSIQIYVDRVIMNMEYESGNTSQPITVSSSFIDQWKQWRQWYSIWGSNREVFLYPENWLEPELRDDKSPFFTELESELLQEEVNDSNVQDAFLNYLGKVQEVSRMEPVGTCDEVDSSGQTITHVFSRSHSDPDHYYYRKLVADVWSPWEEVNLSIKSNHIVPIVWDNKLHLFWLTFREKRAKRKKSDIQGIYNAISFHWSEWFYNDQDEQNINGTNTNDDGSTDASVYYNQIEVTVNWSEYKNGAWTKQKSGKDTMLLKLSPYLESFTYNGGIWPGSIDTSSQGWGNGDFFARISNNRELTVPQIAESRIHIHPFIATSSNSFLSGDLDNLYIMLYFAVNPFDTTEHAQYLHSFRFTDSLNDPTVVRTGSYKWNIPAPANTAFFNMKFIECGNSAPLQSGLPLQVDTYNTATNAWSWSTSYFYEYVSQTPIPDISIRVRANSSSILNNTPNGFFKLVVESDFADNPLEDKFFFSDDKNIFFVRKKYVAPQLTASIASASVVSNGLYNNIGSVSQAVSYINSSPTFGVLGDSLSTLITPLEIPYYYFQTFHHPQIGDFVQVLNKNGIDGLLNLGMQSTPDAIEFEATYSPTSMVYNQYPSGIVDFDYGGAYSSYNWEIFFHAPMMIANRLSTNQQFADAQKWFHYIFNPTSNSDASGNVSQSKNRFWKFKPFYDLATQNIQSISELLNQVSQGNQGAVNQITTWQQDPFDPFAIARLRIQAFMKNVVMSYLDNLIAWADQLFTIDTTESINQATQLYMLASNILGDTPQKIPQKKQPVPSSYQDLVNTGTLDAFSNALVSVEHYINASPTLSPRLVANTAANIGFSGAHVLPAGTLNIANSNIGASVTAASNLVVASGSFSSNSALQSVSFSTSTAVPANSLVVPTGNLGTSSALKGVLFAQGAAVATVSTITNALQLQSPSKAIGLSGLPIPAGATMFYFCLPDNDQLMGYWGTVADRLYKIRNSMNIAGQVQQLPLFDPIVDPGLLIRAKAAGVDVTSVLEDISNSNLPLYRFSYILQKANEICSDVKALGAALLSSLEKKDAEDLALLRSGLEYSVLQSMLLIKQSQLDEANSNLNALNNNLDTVQARYDYYSSRPYMNDKEQQYFNSIKTGMVLQAVQGEIAGLGSTLALLPQFHAQGAFAIGVSDGGAEIGSAYGFISDQLGILATINSAQGNLANISGGFDRRQDDWKFQADAANKELVQINTQILAATIRVNIAQQEYDNQQMQIDNNRTADDFMRNKFTSTDLYSWMLSQIAQTYFQSYQMACHYAQKAGLCYDFELPFASVNSGQILQFGYWDSLKKGLFAGEKLQYDLRNLESSYINSNKRLLELTKHVSVAMFSPEQVINLRNTGSCSISLPEELFDLDYPGHYSRTIKSVSISIPCVAGPYTTVPCTLFASSSLIRRSASSSPSALAPVTNVPTQAIATSTAQNDNGMFEFNFRDERYLPFEGLGAISTWSIQLGGISPNNVSGVTPLRPFDPNTISDIILHIKYTAMDGSNTSDTTGITFGQNRSNNLYTLLTQGSWHSDSSTTPPVTTPVQRYFSLKYEFSNQWFAFVNAVVSGVENPRFAIELDTDMFPFFCNNRNITIIGIYLQSRLKPGISSNITIADTGNNIGVTLNNNTGNSMHTPIGGTSTILSLAVEPLNLSFSIHNSSGADLNLDTVLDDMYFVVSYQLS